MSDASSFGFGKFIPGFDFLQGLAQSAGSAAKPLGGMPQWVAPTVSIEEVEKRITELKAVQFWLEQNGRALAATIQALEVQRMTLSTLKGMNVSMGELAKSFPFPGAAEQAAAMAQDFSAWPINAAAAAGGKAGAGSEAKAGGKAEAKMGAKTGANGPADAEPTQAALNQAMQWWGALTQQFQQIAAKALAEPVPPETLMAAQRATEMAGGLAKATMDQVMSFGKASAEGAAQPAAKTAKAAAAKSAADAASKSAAKPAAKKAAARPAAKKAAAKTGGSRAH
ncbi:hypothetical protein GCM10010975_17430 [Comamonas phosphati]|nr:hypothetical protein GCM10010975_17430 [Comamonas phosphati]